jgi:hypothetical protein
MKPILLTIFAGWTVAFALFVSLYKPVSHNKKNHIARAHKMVKATKYLNGELVLDLTR